MTGYTDDWEEWLLSQCMLGEVWFRRWRKKGHSSCEQMAERHGCLLERYAQLHEPISGWEKTRVCTKLHALCQIKQHSCGVGSHFSRNFSWLFKYNWQNNSFFQRWREGIISNGKEPRQALERWIHLPSLGSSSVLVGTSHVQSQIYFSLCSAKVNDVVSIKKLEVMKRWLQCSENNKQGSIQNWDVAELWIVLGSQIRLPACSAKKLKIKLNWIDNFM